jgi:glycosyltransferase involved in cell wall biosynthesis
MLLEKKIKYFGLQDNIQCLGYLKNEEAFQTISSSKLFIFPSYEEGFGVTILQAISLGIPVIAWDLPVYNSIYKAGIIKVKTGDILELSKMILTLLSDEKRRARISSEAK